MRVHKSKRYLIISVNPQRHRRSARHVVLPCRIPVMQCRVRFLMPGRNGLSSSRSALMCSLIKAWIGKKLGEGFRLALVWFVPMDFEDRTRARVVRSWWVPTDWKIVLVIMNLRWDTLV